MKISRTRILKAVGLIFLLAVATNVLLCVEWKVSAPETPNVAIHVITTSRADAEDKQRHRYVYNVTGPTIHTTAPSHVASLFPAGVNPAVSLPPLSHHNHRRNSTEKSPDIFRTLERWGNLSLDFHASHVSPWQVKPKRKLSPYERGCTREEANGTVWWKKPAECYMKGPKKLPHFQKSGNHILFTLRTTASLHSQRLPLVFQTWLSTVNRSNVVLVTDGQDKVLEYRAQEADIRIFSSVSGYGKLCEKAGDELSLMFLPGMEHYQWTCHVDDDMYVNLRKLVHVLNIFEDTEPVYFGRSGTYPGPPRTVLKESLVGTPGDLYDFAVGGLYCLNRPMLDLARKWLGGRMSFGLMCNATKEPEDVTVGFVVGVLLGLDLNHTLLIHSHGNDLAGVYSDTLFYQVGISYGFGNVQWGSQPNAVNVPHYLFPLAQDPSRFLSLHCHYHREVDWCKTQKRILLEKKFQLYSKHHRTNR